jgi:radical SAM protein with 4Fe4S-binding SPASM domain
MLSSSVILRSEPQYYETYAVFDYRKVSTEFLTEEEYRVLERLSRQPSFSDELAEELHVDHGKCDRFLKRMVGLGYVGQGEILGEVSSPRADVDPGLFKRFPIPFLSAPMSVDVFVTSRCNLRCAHCFASSSEGNASELVYEDLEFIFNQLESMGVFEVRINGGEPLLHHEIDKILAFLRKKRFRKVMLTNGTLLDGRIVKLLKESGTIPTISLDDSQVKSHDSFRGVEGAFDKTIKAMRLLRDCGVEYGINCCVNRTNMVRYEEIITLAEKCGASRIAFLDLKPTGRMKNNLSLVPSYREYEGLMAGLLVAKAKHRKIDVALDVFLHCYPLRESILEAKKGFVSCSAGKTRLSIDSDGFVYPCNMAISNPQWRMGNVKNDSISDIWFSSKWDFFRGEVKVQDLEKCRSCGKLNKCKDFYCRLLPYAASGNLFGPHPKCS